MTPDFDPYAQWLGLPPQSMPANHYSLLGLKRFEPDQQTIAAAAAGRLNLLRQHAAGPHATAAKQLFHEVVAARQCLLDAAARAAYDAQLRTRGPETARPAAAPKGVSPPPLNAAAPAQRVSPPGKPPQAPVAPPEAAARSTKPPRPAQAAANAKQQSSRSPAVGGAPPPAPPPPPPASPPPAPVANDPTAPPVAAWSGIEDISEQAYVPRPTARSKSKSRRAAAKRPNKRSDKGRKPDDADDSDRPGRRRWILIGAAATVLLIGGGVGGWFAFFRSGGAKPVATASNGSSKSCAGASDAVAQAEPAPAQADVALASTREIAPAGAANANPTTESASPTGEGDRKPAASDEFALFDRAENEDAKEAVEKAIEAGMKVESRDGAGRTLLRRAVMGGREPLVESLILKRADVNTADELGETPLMSAAQRGDARLVSLLLSSGARPDARTLADEEHRSGGLAALHVAVRAGQTEIVQLLLEEKATPDVRSAAGATPLMIACWQHQLPIVQELLNKKANSSLKDLDDQTVLMYAVQGGDKDTVKAILDRSDVTVRSVSKQRVTAIGIALEAKSEELLEMLRNAAKNEAPSLGF